MLFHDRAIIDGPARITRDGYLVAEARVAKANNIQSYRAAELGITDRNPSDVIRVFRPESEVFAHDALASAAHRPITLDHPKEDVTAANWKALSVGDIGGDVIRDGEFVRVPLKVMDASAIRAARTTHQEFSLGYSADLDMTPGKFGDAEYDASMRNIRINHLALCDSARGGPELRIVDERPPQLRDQEKPTMKIKIGDAEVDVTDGAAVAVAVGTLNQKLADAETRVGTLTGELTTAKTSIEAKDGEIAALKQQLKDAEVTPAKLQQLADARAQVIARAKSLKADIVTDGKDDATIRKEAVTAKLGDAAKDMSDAAIEGAFTALTKDAKPADSLTQVISGQPINFGDERAAYEADRSKARAGLRDAWKSPFNAADAAAA